jgi:hypothetical protein
MVEAKPRFHAALDERIDQPIVEGKAGFIGGAASFRQYAGPRHRKAISADPELLHQRNVFAVAVIVIAGDIAGVAARDFAG